MYGLALYAVVLVHRDITVPGGLIRYTFCLFCIILVPFLRRAWIKADNLKSPTQILYVDYPLLTVRPWYLSSW